MNKILFLGDLHFGARNDNLNYIRHTLMIFKEFLMPLILNEGIKTIIQVGDIFDRRKYINFLTLYTYYKEFFDVLKENEIKMYVIPGNHDIYYKDTLTVNSLQLLLSDYENIQLIMKPEEIEIYNEKFLFVPWICNDNYNECLKAIKETTCPYLVGHFEFEGFEMARGIVCTHGLSRNDFKKFELVISGHFHHRSQIGNILYIGTPYEMTWIDYDDPKGIYIFENRKLNFIENPIKLFYKLIYDDSTDIMENIINDEDFSVFEGSYLKIIVKNKSNLFLFDKFIDKLEKSNPIDVNVIEEKFNLTKKDENDIIEQSEDTGTFIRNIINDLEINVDKNNLTIFMVNLLQEAQNKE